MRDEGAVRRAIESIQNKIEQAQFYMDTYAEYRGLTPEHDDFDPQTEAETRISAAYALEDAIHVIRAFLASDPMLQNLLSAFNKALPDPLTKIDHYSDPYGESESFPAVDATKRYFQLALVATGYETPVGNVEVVDTILKNIGKSLAYFKSKNIVGAPPGETVVRQFGYGLLKAAFPDTHPDGGVKFILSNGQVRKPDAAIPSLRVCIEFKYADTEIELGKRVGEVVDDMSTYGDPRYDIFRAVFYTPDSSITHEMLTEIFKERLKKMRPKFSWEAFLVNGPNAGAGIAKVGRTKAGKAKAKKPKAKKTETKPKKA